MKDSIVVPLVGFGKFLLAGLVTLSFRLVTPILGLPNVSPLMATQLAGAKAYQPWVAGLYGFLGMFALDALTSGIGPWTWNTSICYALVGIAGGYYMKNKPVRLNDFLIVSIVGTLSFDIATGIIPTLADGKTLLESFMLQAPFTARHLGGNVFFALFAPWFANSIMRSLKVEMWLLFKGARA